MPMCGKFAFLFVLTYHSLVFVLAESWMFSTPFGFVWATTCALPVGLVYLFLVLFGCELFTKAIIIKLLPLRSSNIFPVGICLLPNHIFQFIPCRAVSTGSALAAAQDLL